MMHYFMRYCEHGAMFGNRQRYTDVRQLLAWHPPCRAFTFYVRLFCMAQDGTQPPYLPVTLGPDEAEEVRFQAAHLAYIWGRAVALGIEAQLAPERAEYWCWRLEQRATLRDFQDLRHGFQVSATAAGLCEGVVRAAGVAAVAQLCEAVCKHGCAIWVAVTCSSRTHCHEGNANIT